MKCLDCNYCKAVQKIRSDLELKARQQDEEAIELLKHTPTCINGGKCETCSIGSKPDCKNRLAIYGIEEESQVSISA